MIMIRDILMYMDRVYVAQSHLTPVYNLGLTIFREEIIDQTQINNYLRVR
jgi:cullin 3